MMLYNHLALKIDNNSVMVARNLQDGRCNKFEHLTLLWDTGIHLIFIFIHVIHFEYFFTPNPGHMIRFYLTNSKKFIWIVMASITRRHCVPVYACQWITSLVYLFISSSTLSPKSHLCLSLIQFLVLHYLVLHQYPSSAENNRNALSLLKIIINKCYYILVMSALLVNTH